MMNHLVECGACHRHVRVGEEACPFCAAPLSAELRATPLPRRAPARLSRAALYAFGATSVSAVVACSTATPLYGAPALDSGLDNGRPDAMTGMPDAMTGMDAAFDAPVPMPLYGGPGIDAAPGIEAGTPDATGDAANGDDGGGVAPAYGAPADAG